MEDKKVRIDLRRVEYETLIEERHEAGVNWVTAKIIYDRYDEGTEEIRSRIMMKIGREKPELGRNEILDLAKSTDEWTKFLDEKNEAKRAMLEYENLMGTLEWKLKAKQSIMANDREERKRI